MEDTLRIHISLTNSYFSFYSPKDTDQQKPYDVLVLIAVSIVESICKRDFQNLSFHCGPECTSPKCPGFPDDSLSHFAGQRRRHVIDVYPAQSSESFKCLNFRSEDEANYWLRSGSRQDTRYLREDHVDASFKIINLETLDIYNFGEKPSQEAQALYLCSHYKAPVCENIHLLITWEIGKEKPYTKLT